MIEEGKRAPAFKLNDQDGTPVRLSDFKGRHVVLYFYPKADTPGCTTQACGIRDHEQAYDDADAIVLGVSPDPPERLAKFADKHALGFTLLSDPDHKVAEAYGVWVEKSMYGRKYFGNERTTFLIGPTGKVERIFRKVRPAEHDELVLGALEGSAAAA
jgi:thioredoxin-dependent peroxiredoxin